MGLIFNGNKPSKIIYNGVEASLYFNGSKIWPESSYEIWTNDTKTYTSSNGSTTAYMYLDVPATTNYNYVLLEYDVKIRVISGNDAYWGGVRMAISPSEDWSKDIEFNIDGYVNNYFTCSYIYALTSIFTSWTNSNIISTTGTGTLYDGSEIRYVRNSSYFSSLNTWYRVRYIFDQANKKLYFYFGNNKVYMGYANLNMLSGEIVNKIWLYSSETYAGFGSPSEVSIKNIKCGGFPTLQAAIDY